jgi:alpha-1,2-mannosyltransferase
MSSAPPRWFSVIIGATLSALAALVGFTATAGFTRSIFAATVVGVIAASAPGIVLRRLLSSASARVTAAGVPQGVRRLFAIGALLLIGQLLLAAAFIINPNLARWDSTPWTPQRSNHSCVSSYWVACDRIGSARDIYAEEIYSLPQVDPSAPRVGRPLGPLLVDQYEYPPAFLVLPRLLAAVTTDFWAFRRVWFALNLGVVVGGLMLVAARFDRILATPALWLAPFVLLAPPSIITLVMGNVQLAIIAVSMIAMLMFERKRHAAGGALLAYAVVSKLYPGLLLLYLLLRRDWRAVAWTAVFAMAFVAVSIADFGAGPYVAFATHMPKLLSGEAFPAFRNPAAIAINESIPGLVFKLHLFGVPHMGFAVSRAVGSIYTVVAIALTARLALRPVGPGREPLAWITILILATMRSPFLPTYAAFPSMWLATLLAALTWRRSRVFATAVIAWIVLAFTFGTGAVPPQVNALWTFAHTVAAFVLVAIVFRMAGTLQGDAANRSVVATVGG